MNKIEGYQNFVKKENACSSDQEAIKKHSEPDEICSYVFQHRNDLSTEEAIVALKDLSISLSDFSKEERRKVLITCSKTFEIILQVLTENTGEINDKDQTLIFNHCKRIALNKDQFSSRHFAFESLNKIDLFANRLLRTQNLSSEHLKNINTEGLVNLVRYWTNRPEGIDKLELLAYELAKRNDIFTHEIAYIGRLFAKSSILNLPLFNHLAKLAISHKENFQPLDLVDLLWSFANLGIQNQSLFSEFEEVLDGELLANLSPANASLLLWSYCVFKPVFPVTSLFNRLLSRVESKNLDNFGIQQLMQVYQAGKALNILKDLKFSGSLLESFKNFEVFETDKITNTQKKIESIVVKLTPGWEWASEYVVLGTFRCDLYSRKHGIVLEVDGPHHFIAGTTHYKGSNHMKNWILRELGIGLVRLPYTQIDERSQRKLQIVISESLKSELKRAQQQRKNRADEMRRLEEDKALKAQLALGAVEQKNVESEIIKKPSNCENIEKVCKAPQEEKIEERGNTVQPQEIESVEPKVRLAQVEKGEEVDSEVATQEVKETEKAGETSHEKKVEEFTDEVQTQRMEEEVTKMDSPLPSQKISKLQRKKLARKQSNQRTEQVDVILSNPADSDGISPKKLETPTIISQQKLSKNQRKKLALKVNSIQKLPEQNDDLPHSSQGEMTPATKSEISPNSPSEKLGKNKRKKLAKASEALGKPEKNEMNGHEGLVEDFLPMIEMPVFSEDPFQMEVADLAFSGEENGFLSEEQEEPRDVYKIETRNLGFTGLIAGIYSFFMGD